MSVHLRILLHTGRAPVVSLLSHSPFWNRFWSAMLRSSELSRTESRRWAVATSSTCPASTAWPISFSSITRDKEQSCSRTDWARRLRKDLVLALEYGRRGARGQRSRRVLLALLHGPEQIADLPVPVAESPGAVRIGHPERSHLVEYLAPNSVFNSLPRQRSSPHLRPDERLVTIDRVLHHASLGVA